jgi:hypothetical protein
MLPQLGEYVSENNHVHDGLTLDIRWAATIFTITNAASNSAFFTETSLGLIGLARRYLAR